MSTAWVHGTDLQHAVFSPDGRRLLSVGGDGLRLWHAATGERIHAFEEGGPPLAAEGIGVFTRGGSRVHAYGRAPGMAEPHLRTFDAGSGARVDERPFPGPLVAASSHGSRALVEVVAPTPTWAILDLDDPDGGVVWLDSPPLPEPGDSLAGWFVGEEGDRLVTASRTGVAVHRTSDGRRLRALVEPRLGHVRGTAVSSGTGRVLVLVAPALEPPRLELLDLDGRELDRIEAGVLRPMRGWFDPRGERVARARRGGGFHSSHEFQPPYERLDVFDLSERTTCEERSSLRVRGAVWSPDGRTVLWLSARRIHRTTPDLREGSLPDIGDSPWALAHE